MNGPTLLTDQNQDILKDNLSKGTNQKGQVKSSQSKDNNGSPNDLLSAFNHKSSLSKLNNDLINSSFNQMSNSTTQQLADILFYCRKRLDENSVDYLTKVIPLDCEKEEMELIEAPELCQYIKQIINYLSKCKLEMETKMQQLIKPDEEYMNEYEGMLQKMEAECRNHIRIEQQLKIYAETAQERLEFVERDLEVLEKQNEELKVQLTKMTKTNEELINLNKSRDEKIDQLKKRIKELEEQNDKQIQQMHHQSSSSLTKPSKIPVHNNRGSIRDSIDHNLPLNGTSYIEQNSSGGALPSSGGNSHKNLNSQNQSAHPSSNENSSQKHQSQQQQNQHALQNKRNKRSVSTLNSGNDEGSNTQREVMRQLENNVNNNRLKTEPYHNTSQSTGQNSNALKSTSSSHQQYNITGNQNTQSNTYSQDALAYLLGNSNHKPSSSSSQNNRSSANLKEDNKRIMDKYLFDKGQDKAALKKIYGDSAKSKSFIDLNKSQKNQNSSRGPSSHASKGSQPSSSQNQQQNLIKQIQQQQIMKQVQSQAVLNRIQQKINQTIQNSGSNKNSNGNNSSNNLSNLYQNNNSGSNNNTLSQSQTQRALSRSKSRNKIKDYSNDTSRIQKEYNIYTLNPQNVHKVQQAKNSPQKNTKADTHRSQSVDAYSKINTRQQGSYNLK